ncbi:OTU protein [Maublancomyces gigas]|uniref:OTU protein n=1 Tax=Discina gigas TaxID=1032678 RepID=A0ABR3GFB0_9PEZI
MEELLARHRKESRDLISRATQKKKLATKKTRKGVISECEALERDLELKQAREISELTDPESLIHDNYDDQDGQAADVDADADADTDAILQTLSIACGESATTTTTTTNTNTTPPETTTSKKPSRQKARLARRAADLAALSAEAEAEAASLPDLRSLEIAAMQNRLSTLKLTEHFITPDGHCLYSAFADQVLHSTPSLLLPPSEAVLDYKLVRRKCADYMASHRADFEPFLEDAFDEHVRKVGETAEWGGQTEVLALAKVFGVVANVVQAEGRGVEKMNDGGTNGEVWLGYYRHSFGLGEHYNSLRRKV